MIGDSGTKWTERGVVALLLVLLFYIAPSGSVAADRLTLYTVNYPLKYFAQRIGGASVEVRFPAPADVDPAFWSPDAATINAYQKADLIILNGAGYARWVKRAALPRLRSIDTSAALAAPLIEMRPGLTHSHGPGARHAHSGIAFTTWLDFDQAIQQAASIRDTLQRRHPEQRVYFSDNFDRLERDLRALDAAMLALSKKLRDSVLMASHPIYQYLARRYDLDIDAVTWEPGEFPAEQQWQAFSARLPQRALGLMLWEAAPLRETEHRLEAMQVYPVVFAPCMNTPEEGDFLSVMQQNLRNLQRAVERELE